jgi:hypothetical protein
LPVLPETATGAATESPDLASPAAMDTESASPESPPLPVSPESTSVSAEASPELPESPLLPESPVSASAPPQQSPPWLPSLLIE